MVVMPHYRPVSRTMCSQLSLGLRLISLAWHWIVDLGVLRWQKAGASCACWRKASVLSALAPGWESELKGDELWQSEYVVGHCNLFPYVHACTFQLHIGRNGTRARCARHYVQRRTPRNRAPVSLDSRQQRRCKQVWRQASSPSACTSHNSLETQFFTRNRPQ